jgi:hypothetical protein
MANAERRGAVRVPARLAMEIKVGGDAAHVESLNVSANGVYFASKSHIPMLTKLRITLDLSDEEGKSKNVACDGVVVRSEPEDADPSISEYQVACYFTSIGDRDQELLEAYILKNVPF